MWPRGIKPHLLEALTDTPVVVLHGARQTGKTTLARQVAGGDPPRRYLTLDDSAVLSAAVTNPAGFVEGLPDRVVIDEVQRAPGLFPAIKAAVDADRRPGRFLLTGSANMMLLPRLAEHLAGRMEIITLWPLSQGEIAGRPEGFVGAVFGASVPELAPAKAAQHLIERLLAGGYPEPLGRPAGPRRSAWHGSYVTSILQRDVRDLSNVEGLAEFPRLLGLLASRTAGLLNFADIARGLSMPQSTLKRYMALLEATFLTKLLPAWSANLGLRLTKSPKQHLTDTGLAASLIGAERDRLERDGALLGPLLESFVVMEVVKQSGWSRTAPRAFHFRTLAGREVDLVLEDRAGRLVGIEIKASASVDSRDFDGLKALAEIAGERFIRGIVLHSGKTVVAFDRRMMAMPISALWELAPAPAA